jgi:hypothetical protein
MKAVVKMIYSDFETVTIDDREMEQLDSLIAGPVGIASA